jgi:hypothetical protein
MWWALEEERSFDPCSNPTPFSGFDVNALCSDKEVERAAELKKINALRR